MWKDCFWFYIQPILHLWIFLNLTKNRFFLQQPPVDRATLSPVDAISKGKYTNLSLASFVPVQTFVPSYDSAFSKCKQTASLIGHCQSRNYEFNSQNTKPLVQPHQHSHLASWGIFTILRRWGLEPTNKQPSDVYTWSTTLPPEAVETHLHCQWEELEVAASAWWWFCLYLGEVGNIKDPEQTQNTWLKQNMVNMLHLGSIFEARHNKPASQLGLPSKSRFKRSPHGSRIPLKSLLWETPAFKAHPRLLQLNLEAWEQLDRKATFTEAMDLF